MATNHIAELEDRLWAAADQLRANSDLKASEYSVPVLGLIFLRYADFKFTHATEGIRKEGHEPNKLRYQAAGVMYLPEDARFGSLLNLPEGANIGRAINDAMTAIERENEDLQGTLPKSYNRIEDSILVNLLKQFNSISMDIEGDAFGRIYEYFLGKFALTEGQGGGEFFTPTSIVKLIVEIIEPFHGRIFDPACGSGGMFVQSANFVKAHHKSANTEISVYGQEKTAETVRLGKMNLAVHGLHGDIKQGNSYYEDIHESVGKFDYVMANPPFNVDGIDKERIRTDPRFPFGMPKVDNGNYMWIQAFYSALNGQGRAGFVMANSASDARSSELEIRKQLLQEKIVDVMVAVGPNMFYTVTLPCQLWFLDKAKKSSDRADKVLFLDVRHIFKQIDRAHREFEPEQIEFISNVVKLYRGEEPEFKHGSEGMFEKYGISAKRYEDSLGLCRVATTQEIEEQDWSLNPGRYVGVREGQAEDVDFVAMFEKLTEDLSILNAQAHELEELIETNSRKVLGDG